MEHDQDVVWTYLHRRQLEPDKANSRFPDYPKTFPDYHLYYDQFIMSQDPSATTSILNADTPSWSEIDGILSDKYKTDEDSAPMVPDPTQSTQETLVQQALLSQVASTPLTAYYSQPQFRERSFETLDDEFLPMSSLPSKFEEPMSTPPRFSSSTSSRGSFGSSQRQRMATLRRELLEEESKVMANSDQLASAMRKQAVSALKDPEHKAVSHSFGLDSSQQLSHSLFDEQSRTRLKIAKPPSIHSDPATYNSVSVDITPLTEDLLLNSRTEHANSDGARTISDGQFPNDDDDIIFTPLSDDDVCFTKTFATPPRVVRKTDRKLHRPSARYGKGVVQIQSHGKVIGNTELGSFDETSSLSVIDKDTLLGKNRDTVKPLRRHAWSDSETEHSLSKSLTKQQFEETKLRHELRSHKEIVSTDLVPVERPRSAFAVLSPSAIKYRPFTAPSSEKMDKFDLHQPSGRFLSAEPVELEKKTSDSSLNSNDYPNLKNSFVSLQNTILSDIAALRKEIVEKQEGTEKLKAEFSDFKHAYYTAMLDQQAVAKKLADANIQTSQPPTDKENRVPQPIPDNKDSSYSECDSETDRQLATLKALQRSLREQSNERYLRDIEQRMDAKTGKAATSIPSVTKVDRMQQSSPCHLSSRSIQTTLPRRVTVDAKCNTSDVELRTPTAEYESPQETPKTSAAEEPRSKTPLASHSTNRRTATPKPETDSYNRANETGGSVDSSLDSTERATRDLFMDILRKKAEMDEAEQNKKKNNNNTSTPKHTQPTAQLLPGKKSFTPASVVSDDSTLTDGTFVIGEDVTALNALWKEFMKFVVQSRVVKQHKTKSSKKDPCIKLDIEKLQKIHESFSKETYKKTRKESEKRFEKKRTGLENERRHKVKRVPPPEMFDVSAGELKDPRGTYSVPDSPACSIDSREERINRLIAEIEDERKRRLEKRPGAPAYVLPAELDSVPVKDVEIQTPSPPPPPPPIRSPVAFEISLDTDSVTSEEVERAPGYPNIIFKTDRLQDAFQEHKQRFIKKSRRRALQIQLCKEARERYATTTPPERPRPTIDAKYFAAFDIPPPRMKVISHREMRKHSRKIYEGLSEVQAKKQENKIARERTTHRLRAKLFNKQVVDTVLGKKHMNSVRVY